MTITKNAWGKRLGLALVALTMALTGSLLGAHRAYAAAGITAESVELGETTTITVTGCQPPPADPDARARLVIVDSTGKELDSRLMSSDSALWIAPNPGDYTAKVTCKGTDGIETTASVTFNVTMIPISVTPAAWQAGTEVALAASGYQGGETVYITIESCGAVSVPCNTEFVYKEWQTTADASGDLKFSVQVPTSLPAGQWYFKATTVKSNLRRWSPTVTTTASPTTIDVYPAAWTAGNFPQLLASGFAKTERVSVAIVAAPNCTVGSICTDLGKAYLTVETYVDATGRLNESVPVPADLPVGKWAMIATGMASGTVRTSVVVATTNLEVSPADWKPGTRVELKASGFTPGESVKVTLFGYITCAAGGGDCSPQPQWTATANSAGAIALGVDVPAGLTGGDWQFQAAGATSGTRQVSPLVKVAAQNVQVTPAVWAPGSTVEVKAGGFQPGETVVVAVNGAFLPCAKSLDPGYDSRCPFGGTWKKWTATANANGEISLSVVVPADLPFGMWDFTATGQSSKIQRTSVTGRTLPPFLRVDPASWKVGGTIKLQTYSLAPGESVTLTLVGTKSCAKGATCSKAEVTWKTWTTTAVANANGEWSYSAQVPKDLPAGTWKFVAKGTTSGTTATSATFKVNAGLPPTGD